MGATHIQNRTKGERGNEFSVALKAFGAVAIFISWPAGLCVGIALLCITPSDTMSHWGGGVSVLRWGGCFHVFLLD